jgi:hypothetical protein
MKSRFNEQRASRQQNVHFQPVLISLQFSLKRIQVFELGGDKQPIAGSDIDRI